MMDAAKLWPIISDNVEDVETKTPAAIAAEINEYERLTDQRELVSSATLIRELGMADAVIVLGTLQSAAETNPVVQSAANRLDAAGLEFDDPLVQTMIPTLATAGNWQDELRDKVANLGRIRIRLVDTNVTEQQVAAATKYGSRQRQIAKLEVTVANELNERIWPAVATGDKASVLTAIVALRAAVEQS